MSRDVTLYLDDMVEACRRIGQYTEGLSRAELVNGTMAHDAVLRNLEVLGEAAKNLPADVRGLDVEIPWRRITGLRDVLAHAYFGIDDDIVWSVVAEEVPSLQRRLVALRARL
ncbi:DUF86 domain-containing protein [Luteitalea sp.]|uniref:DUF86 domain-containing protein n=1 Tax=Luteitalea sp. TaxID=2004800 RepID=UPI0037C6559B